MVPQLRENSNASWGGRGRNLTSAVSPGLAPILAVFNTIRKINAEGTTVLIVEQNVKQTLLVANRGYVLETGKITKQGTGEALLADEHVKTAYLGV